VPRSSWKPPAAFAVPHNRHLALTNWLPCSEFHHCHASYRSPPPSHPGAGWEWRRRHVNVDSLARPCMAALLKLRLKKVPSTGQVKVSRSCTPEEVHHEETTRYHENSHTVLARLPPSPRLSSCSRFPGLWV
jgi:hypothetical protein